MRRGGIPDIVIRRLPIYERTLKQMLSAGVTRPQVARWFANAFDDPRRYFPQFTDPAAAQRFIDDAA